MKIDNAFIRKEIEDKYFRNNVVYQLVETMSNLLVKELIGPRTLELSGELAIKKALYVQEKERLRRER